MYTCIHSHTHTHRHTHTHTHTHILVFGGYPGHGYVTSYRGHLFWPSWSLNIYSLWQQIYTECRRIEEGAVWLILRNMKFSNASEDAHIYTHGLYNPFKLRTHNILTTTWKLRTIWIDRQFRFSLPYKIKMNINFIKSFEEPKDDHIMSRAFLKSHKFLL